MPDAAPPRCFISYSWDSEDHQAWVRKLATRLRECGVDAILDKFHCKPGMDLTRFMGTSIRESSHVLLVCTPTFAEKANAGAGGVGYECSIVTGEMFTDNKREAKFVPLVRDGNIDQSLPSFLKNRLWIDLREDNHFEDRLEDLVRHIWGEPLYTPPPLGKKPDWKKAAVPSPEQKSNVATPAHETIESDPPQDLQPVETFTNSIGMTFVLIPPGTFMMGSHVSSEEVVQVYRGTLPDSYKCEHPLHEVAIGNAFYLQTTQVTQGQ